MVGKPKNKISEKPAKRLIANRKKAMDPYHVDGSCTYRTIATFLRAQFPEAAEDWLLNELAKIGTEYAAMLWDLPERNDAQVLDSIIQVSDKAHELLDVMISLGPSARLHVFGKWLPDPEAPRMQLGGLSLRPNKSSIDEPLRIIDRQINSFMKSPELKWLFKLINLKDEWSPLREDIRARRTSAKKTDSMPGQQIKDDCKWLLNELSQRSYEAICQYPLAYHGLAQKIHEVVTGEKAGAQQFR